MPAFLLICVVGIAQAVTPGVADQSTRGDHRAPLAVTADWLSQHLDDPNLVLIHAGDRAEYDAGHIPGAQFLSIADIATPLNSDPMIELLPPDRLQEAFERLGITNASRIIVYFGKDQIQVAARIVLTLDYMGLAAQSSMLDGGMPGWSASGRALTAAVRVPARGKLTANVQQGVVVDLAAVRAMVTSSDDVLVDARLPNFYKGESAGKAARAGHIPGAVNLPYSSVFDQSMKLKSRSELEALFRDAGVKPGQRVVTYCHTGQTASLVYLVARYLGYDASLYDGSYTEWSSKPDLPVEK